MQAILEVELALPLDHMGKEIAEEGGVLIEQSVQLEGVLRGDQLIKSHWAWRQRGPIPRGQLMLRIGTLIAHPFEDHSPTI